MRLTGRGSRGLETYPGRVSSAVSALTNRYLCSQIAPAAFTAVIADEYIVAAANVTRRASGIFVINVQVPVVLASAETLQWAAGILGGSTASGGTAAGDWLVAGSAISVTSESFASTMGISRIACPAGGLGQTVTLVGLNPTPLPVDGSGVLVVYGATVGSVQTTPGVILASAYELP